ncbi:MAG: S1 RNA-binding domain-containing protein, partial [Kangiellaceae bacterium]|nr:S1 RNA-binding domain-containing protein [Kangiellaceae bacterium]
VHVSEMDWTNKNIHPSKVVNLGDEVEVMVLDIDEERRRISLGLKQCVPNPWTEFASKFNKNDKVTGKIKSITDFGIFIGLDGGIDGLVHLSDISWTATGEEAVRDYKKGDEVEAVVLSVDAERERISLGIKQVDSDPFAQFLAEHAKGSMVTGKAIEVEARGVKVALADNVEGYLRASEISDERVDDAGKHYAVGDDVEAKFTAVDKKNRVITLSIKAKHKQEEAEAVAEFSKDKESSAPATLGDLLKEQMDRD